MIEEPKPEREYLLSTDKACPYDGAEPQPDNDSSVIFNPMSLTFRKCPSCGRRFKSSLLLDATLAPMTELGRQIGEKAFPLWLGATAASSTKRLEEVREDNADVKLRLDEFSQALTDLRSSLPPDRGDEVEALQKQVDSVRGRVEDTTGKIDEAKAELLGLIPDQADLAYMKLARIEVKDLRDLLERHIDNDHKGEAVVTQRRQLAQAKIALAVAATAAVVSAAIAILK